MSRRRAPAPGRHVASGTLRVDAGRAVAKLREYQLPDPSTWILEALRGVLAAGATSVDVAGDADDIWVRARGTGPRVAQEADALGSLFDELVSPEVARGRRWLRLLATAVNTALGLDPRFVDLLHRDGDAQVMRIRYVPDQLMLAAGEDAANLEGARTALAPDALPPDVDFLLHLRRAPSLAVLGRMAQGLFGGGELPELQHVRDAARDGAVPITLGPLTLGPDAARELVRMPLAGLPAGWRGFLAIDDPATGTTPTVGEATPSLELAEHGVRVERQPVPGWLRGRSPLPLRVFLDAERLPTNASRSKVRLGDRAVRRALKRAEAALPALGEAFVEAYGAGTATRDAALRRAALHLLAGYDVRASDGTLPEGLRPLLELPLIRDALGRPRNLASFPRPLGADAVYQGQEPLPEDLAPFVADLPWVRLGDDAAALFHGEALPDASALLRAARASLEARERFERRPTRNATLPARRGTLAHARFRVPESAEAPKRLRGVHGELRLMATGSVGPRRQGSGELTVLLEGRDVERLTLASAWPFEAVVSGPGLRPRPDYEGVEAGPAKTALIDATRLARNAALGALFSAAGQREAPRVAFVDVRIEGEVPTRGALLQAALALDMRSVDAPLRASVFAAPLCPEVLADGTRRMATLGELAQRTKEPSWLLAPPGDHRGTGVPPAGRSALCLRPDQAEKVLAQVAPGAKSAPQLLRYPLRTGAPTPWRQLLRPLALPGVALVKIDDAADHRGVVAWGIRDAAVHLFHRGERVGREPFEPALGPCAIVRDDDALVPDPQGSGLGEPAVWRDTLAWEGKALMALLRGIAGEAPEELLFEGDLRRARGIHRGVLIAAASPRAARILDEASRARIRALPLVRLHGRDAPVSLDALRERGRTLPWLPEVEAPRFDTPGFHPVLADEELARALARLGGLRAKSARTEAEALEAARVREARLAVLRSGPRLSLPAADERSVRWGAGGLEAWAGLAPANEPPALEVEVRVDGRPLSTLRDPGALPLRCILDGDLSLADDRLQEVAPKAKRRLLAMARSGAGKLLARIAEQRPAMLYDDQATRALLGRWAQQRSAKERTTRDRLAEAPAWPTVQGPRASVVAAASKARLRVGQWDGAWLGPDEGDDQRAADAPVLRLPGNDVERQELVSIWRHLAAGRSLANRTRDLRALQGERMLARKLVPVPTLADVQPSRKVRLETLRPERKRGGLLGPGEIGLRDRGGAMLRVYVHGEAAPLKQLEFPLPVVIATESPRLGDAMAKQDAATLQGRVATQLRTRLEALAPALLRATLLAAKPESLSVAERATLRTALLETSFVEAGDVHEVPLFETTAGGWASLADLAAQVDRFGDVWCTTERSILERTRVPHDPERVALRLTPGERDGLARLTTLVDAAEELRLDDQLRRNLARSARRDLRITRPTLGEAEELRWKSARGHLALLRPEDAAQAKVELHREGLPLGEVALQGTWPTLARLDDATLVPDRVHGAAEENAHLRDLLRALRKRSDALLDGMAPRDAPEDAVAVTRIRAKASRHELPSGAVASGVLYLPASVRPEGIAVRGASLRTFRPSVAKGHGATRHLALGGTLMAYVPGKRSSLAELDGLVQAEARSLLGKLARRMGKGAIPAPERPAAMAHLLRGTVAGLLPLRGKLRSLMPAGLVPPRSLAELVALVDAPDPVLALSPDAEDAPRHADDRALAAFVDDGGPVAQVLLDLFGARVRRAKDAEVFAPAPPPPTPSAGRDEGKRATPRRRAPAPASPPAAPEKPSHPLVPLAAHLQAMLDSLSLPLAVTVVVAPRRRGLMVRVDEAQVELAGANSQLEALQAARLARDPRAEAAMRLLAAHAVGLLDVAHAPAMGSTQRAVLETLLEG